MINEEALTKILEAADFQDPEDLRIRSLLIAALRKSGAYSTGLVPRTIQERDRHHSRPAG
jgi:hypothetical protein